MMDIYGLVEVSSGIDLTFYFVTIDVTEANLILSDRSQGKNPLNITIPLKDIKKFNTQTVYGTDQISFWYNDVNYKFVEYGNRTISFLGDYLDSRLAVLA
ncbi:hypothetical protein P7H60_00915 [Vagococcus carniphilus]|uniref:hypothetical protein n=1 Tax=Vagococcus carniphilus TaxID=218144 RepID=UPI002890B8D4|nr:hypothetical protein [Vagococcus carniphilus]MDT2847726.1 hypothetical protein [Vagococcus carniphilus]